MLSAALDLENDLSIPLTSDPSFASAIPRFLGQERVGGGREGGGGASGPPALHGLPALRRETAFLGSRPPASTAAAGHRGTSSWAQSPGSGGDSCSWLDLGSVGLWLKRFSLFLEARGPIADGLCPVPWGLWAVRPASSGLVRALTAQGRPWAGAVVLARSCFAPCLASARAVRPQDCPDPSPAWKISGTLLGGWPPAGDILRLSWPGRQLLPRALVFPGRWLTSAEPRWARLLCGGPGRPFCPQRR